MARAWAVRGGPVMFSLLKKWLGRSGPRRTELHFVLYTRKDCHLCADACDLLAAYQKLHGFTLEEIDVDSAPSLISQYGDCVPVVVVNGEVRFRGRVNEVLLRRLLDAKV
jgi:glutaredoxin